MYKCRNCGEVFDEPKTIHECVGEFWGASAYEDWAVCPCCGEENFDEKAKVEREEKEGEDDIEE